MINNITVTNFKVFARETSFNLSKLNLLTGINGRGKSSFLQSMLIIRQSFEKNGFSHIEFNGSCVNLGAFEDVRNKDISREEKIIIKYDFGIRQEELWIEENSEDDMIGAIKNINDPLDISKLKNIHYIAADRVGPQEFYLKSTLPSFVNVGTKGEYVANVLLQKRELQVIESLLIKTQLINEFERLVAHDLPTQTGAWLSLILDNDVKIDVSNEGNKRIITLLFQIGKHKDLRPSNVGFGYTYILPIIVSGLIAKEGELLIVENPEAHLHPKAQHELVLFLARVASTGVQVFIETHSEHILNAVRITTLAAYDILKNNDVSILYFQNSHLEPFVNIPIKENGAIEDWPKGFFDQTETDFNKLFGL